MNNEKTNCFYCNKRLKSFSVNLDWNNRTLHKSCYKKIEENIQLQNVVDWYQKPK